MSSFTQGKPGRNTACCWRRHLKHVKYILPTDKYISKLSDYSGFGRKTTLRINPEQIPDLHWRLANKYHTTGIGQPEVISMSVHNINVKTLMCANNPCINTRTYTVQSRCEPLCSRLLLN